MNWACDISIRRLWVLDFFPFEKISKFESLRPSELGERSVWTRFCILIRTGFWTKRSDFSKMEFRDYLSTGYRYPAFPGVLWVDKNDFWWNQPFCSFLDRQIQFWELNHGPVRRSLPTGRRKRFQFISLNLIKFVTFESISLLLEPPRRFQLPKNGDDFIISDGLRTSPKLIQIRWYAQNGTHGLVVSSGLLRKPVYAVFETKGGWESFNCDNNFRSADSFSSMGSRG